MANATTPTPYRAKPRRKTDSLRGRCRMWLKMRDQVHPNAFQPWSDHRADMDLAAEVNQLMACKGRIDANDKYPGPVSIAIIYFHPEGRDVDGTQVASFRLEEGWVKH